MSKVDVWMPLFIGDYLADTARLNAEQHGAYLLLLMDYWRNGKLPNDDGALANIARMSKAAWKKCRNVIKNFFKIDEKFWVNSRLEKELEQAKKNREMRVEIAKKAAQKRWEKDKEIKKKNDAQCMHDALLQECSSPSPSPLPINKNINSYSNNVSKLEYRDVDKSGITLERIDDAEKEAISRIGNLCKQVRTIGFDASPHFQAWEEITKKHSDKKIIDCAKSIHNNKNKGKRFHLNYLKKALESFSTSKLLWTKQELDSQKELPGGVYNLADVLMGKIVPLKSPSSPSNQLF